MDIYGSTEERGYFYGPSRANFYRGDGSCNSNNDFKVFVYEIPQELQNNAEMARKSRTFHTCKKCIYEQFALEYVLFDYFTSSCHPTRNPDEADYFYLPIIRDVDYRIALSKNGDRSPSTIESALLDAMEKSDMTAWQRVFNVTDKYWRRHNGSDHIFVMPAPVTNFRHQSNMRGFFHYMPQLHSPIFISVELSRRFLLEYPICGSQKNIVVPYPTVDPDFYTGLLFEKDFPMHLPLKERSKLIFYHGGHHGSCERVRASLASLVQDKQLAIQRGDRKREAGFQSAYFCPIPVGDSPSSKRMYDVLNFGCIPVVLSDDLVWAFSNESGGPLTASHFSIQLPQSIVQRDTAAALLQSLQKEMSGLQVDMNSMFNFGRSLPATNTSLLVLLQQLAAEEALISLPSNHSTGIETATPSPTPSLPRKSGVRGRQVVVNRPNSVSKPISKEKMKRNVNNNRRLLSKDKANKAAAVKGKGDKSVLVRLLQRIPKEDILSLQTAGRQVADSYRYYAMSLDVAGVTRDLPPLIANHTVPDGGAIKVLEKLLLERKEKGVVAVAELCQAERRQKHVYVGRYPCSARRRLLWY